jgi:hypothetical protein
MPLTRIKEAARVLRNREPSLPEKCELDAAREGKRMNLAAWLSELFAEAVHREPAAQLDWLRAKIEQRDSLAVCDRRDYPYKAPDLNEWSSGVDLSEVTLAAAFAAGERYGADLERGATYQAAEDWEEEAFKAGTSLLHHLWRSLERRQAHDFPEAPSSVACAAVSADRISPHDVRTTTEGIDQRPRLTCHNPECRGATMVRHPFHGDAQWDREVALFLAAHPKPEGAD